MKPILFNTNMVRAILDNRKSVTRRVIKPQPWCDAPRDCGCVFWDPSGKTNHISCQRCLSMEIPAPKYRPGDILYVRETWAPTTGGIAYKADFPYDMPRWHPSLHMPREAARIFLRVTDVRVEKLQDMQPYDIAFEGVLRQRDFAALWDRTIKKADRAIYGWNSNPWVWVIEFERISREEAENGS